MATRAPILRVDGLGYHHSPFGPVDSNARVLVPTLLPVCSALNNSAPSKTPKTPKTLKQAMPITFSAIATARAVLERRVLQESVDDVNEVDDLDDVVIARNVTPDDLDNVPYEWLDGLKLALRDDNTLVAELQDSEQHGYATDAIGEQMKVYGQANGFEAHLQTTQEQAGGQGRMHPLHILLERPSEDGDDEPFVVFMVADWRCSGPVMLDRARNLLAEYPLALCVVCFKFYPANTVAHELLAAAFAMVLQRGNNGQVHMTQTHPMGNRGVQGSGFRYFRGNNASDLLDNPAPANGLGELLAPSPLFPDAIPMAHIRTSLTQALANARVLEQTRLAAGQRVEQVYFHVMVQGVPPIRLDLTWIFIAGMRGWARSPAHAQQCRAARQAAARNAPARVAVVADGEVARAEAGGQPWWERLWRTVAWAIGFGHGEDAE